MSSSFNLENEGRQVAYIKGGKLDGKYISLSEDNKKVKKKFSVYDLPQESEFISVPSSAQMRFIDYLYGPSGSGKSTQVRERVLLWKKLNPKIKDNVYLFSAKGEDDKLDGIVKRIPLNYNLVDDPITVESASNSLIIFDDTDSIEDEEIKDALYKFLNTVLQVGRSYKINAIITNHLPLSGKFTKIIINEAHSVTYFPHSGSKRGTDYLLENYVGVDRRDIAKIKKLKTRWAYIAKSYPMYCITQKKIFMLDDD